MADVDVKGERQFYYLFKALDDLVQSSDELGTIIGYSIIVSTQVNLPPVSNTKKKRKVEVLNAVYDGLEKTIGDCAPEGGSYEAMRSLQELVVNYLTQEREADKKKAEEGDGFSRKKGPVKLKETLFSIERGFYWDQLRKNGLKLVNAVYRRGDLKNPQNIVQKDYALLESYFAARGGLV